MPNSKTPKGFTLIELMVTISIAGILLGIAIPSFTAIIASNRLTSTANNYLAAVNFTRSEAIKRGQQVTMANSGASSQWENGWSIFVDADGSNAFNDDGDGTLCEANEDCLLRTFDALSGHLSIRTSDSTSYKDFAAYLPSGESKMKNAGKFTLCGESGDDQPQRIININIMGRPSITKETGTCP